jgi:hypothetical protein
MQTIVDNNSAFIATSASSSYKTQRDRVLELLIRAKGGWVPLPEILALHIAQYNSRVHELRKLGYAIQSRQERRDGRVHSFFRLDLGASRTCEPSVGTRAAMPARIEPQGTLFDLDPPSRRDCG